MDRVFEMNIKDLTQAIEQAEAVHAFIYKNSAKFPGGLSFEAYQICKKLDEQRGIERYKASKEDQVKTDDLSRITAQIVAESARQNVVMAEAMSGIDRIMAEYHDDIEEATK